MAATGCRLAENKLRWMGFHFRKGYWRGVVIRDHSSNFIAGISKLFPGITGALVAKSFAAQEAILLVKELRSTHFVLEGDSSTVIKSLLDDDADYSISGHLVKKTRLMLEDYRDFDIQWISRKSNSVAHTQAQHK
ncbi:hypothetical protein ACH5RR_023096 [Cinchona calisaya]|uniref:RNase H type-1 domain-containing protein n=1 Tax=Cinchona calisaya TaxID=153742 RepID=A0ABD2Z9P2_9GENT